ncbi:hypothetical protein N7468_009170 [Penicillium chermesinum]|uniref:Uncharacterized protein n=1 Tax=Penicillium chermesinum TaxID=63820 RepID=A0A9W9TEQ0_9EURO|nr:uncharacterized protein N7468_009170 [Penicillium chermesinum]KAJ5219966.1 hypothetical protein N7468_009170 [Penicillium chermesinum]
MDRCFIRGELRCHATLSYVARATLQIEQNGPKGAAGTYKWGLRRTKRKGSAVSGESEVHCRLGNHQPRDVSERVSGPQVL